ncbi:hypothetical protein [Nitrobacter winogradskyi]|nr:hypothetical protein [Nitrobacter winogradskyi]
MAAFPLQAGRSEFPRSGRLDASPVESDGEDMALIWSRRRTAN